jgi:predicted glycosyltransferase involved in capsule biosynthesis
MFVLTNLIKQITESQVYVFEQNSNNNLEDKVIEKFKKKIIYRKYNFGKEFNKSKIINKLIDQVNTDYVWIIDSDFFANYNKIENYLKKTNADLIKPFEKVILLDKQESDLCCDCGFICLSGRKNYNKALGKFSVAFKTNLAKLCNGYNENYVGWGFQDLDFVKKRLNAKNTKSIKINTAHLYHSVSKSHTYSRNKQLYYS